jgi:hypothetical protein
LYYITVKRDDGAKAVLSGPYKTKEDAEKKQSFAIEETIGRDRELLWKAVFGTSYIDSEEPGFLEKKGIW